MSTTMAKFGDKERKDLESSLHDCTNNPIDTQVAVAIDRPVLAKSFNLLSACATGITTGNAWAVLGGGIVRTLFTATAIH